MTRDEAVALIQQDLGFRSDRATEIVSRLQEAQRLHERGLTLPKFLLLEDQTLTLTADVATVSLPSNYLRRYGTRPYFTPSGEGKKFLRWENIDNARESFAGIESDESASEHPSVMALRKSTIIFYPTPTEALTVYWDYYRKDDLLTSNIENLWLANAPDVLIGYAGLQIAKALRNKAATEIFQSKYQVARLTWFSETVVDEQEDDMVLGANN